MLGNCVDFSQNPQIRNRWELCSLDVYYFPCVFFFFPIIFVLSARYVRMRNFSGNSKQMQAVYMIWYSLIYNTSARHQQHECNISDMNTTQVRHNRHECNTSATGVSHKRHECDTNPTRAENFDFDNDTSKNIFSHPYTYYMASERLQEEWTISF